MFPPRAQHITSSGHVCVLCSLFCSLFCCSWLVSGTSRFLFPCFHVRPSSFGSESFDLFSYPQTWWTECILLILTVSVFTFVVFLILLFHRPSMCVCLVVSPCLFSVFYHLQLSAKFTFPSFSIPSPQVSHLTLLSTTTTK